MPTSRTLQFPVHSPSLARAEEITAADDANEKSGAYHDPVAHLHLIWKCFLMECCWKKTLCRRAAQIALRSGTDLINAGAGEGI
jgi:hypothetical protein